MLLYPRHGMTSFWQVIDVDKDPLAMQFCFSKFLCKRDFGRILEFFEDSVPRYSADRGPRDDKLEKAGPCKGRSGTLDNLKADPHWKVLRFNEACISHASRMAL